jgi:uncharacterized protein
LELKKIVVIGNVLMLIVLSLFACAGVYAVQSLLDSKESKPTPAQYKLGDKLAQPPATAKTRSAKDNALADYKEIKWEQLIPKNWDPSKDFKSLDLSLLDDSDPRAIDALRKLREVWDNAPTEPSMNNAKVRIPGFLVPLDAQAGKVRQFLLVPYFGACLHSPPPPANQIIDVTTSTPVTLQMMDAVWVTGVLQTLISDTSMGTSGYRMSAVKVERYVEPKETKK